MGRVSTLSLYLHLTRCSSAAGHSQKAELVHLGSNTGKSLDLITFHLGKDRQESTKGP